MPQPSQVDPSRTATLRRQYENLLRKGVRATLAALKTSREPPRTASEPRAAGQGAYTHILQLATRAILQPHKPAHQRPAYRLVMDSYLKGQARAYDDQRGLDAIAATTKEQKAVALSAKKEFVAGYANNPEHRERLDNLISRVELELQNLAIRLAMSLTRAYLDQLVMNYTRKQLAAFAEQIGKSITDAERIARTEIIRAHAEGVLDAYERLHVGKVKVLIEWTTAGDNKVCPKCKALEGITLWIHEARGMFPRHPNCRCTPVTHKYTGRMTWEQEYGRRRRLRAIEKSIEAGKPKKRRRAGRPRKDPWERKAKKQVRKLR